jgi:hypothetical protein
VEKLRAEVADLRRQLAESQGEAQRTVYIPVTDHDGGAKSAIWQVSEYVECEKCEAELSKRGKSQRPARKPVPFRRWRVVGEVLRYSAGEGFDEVPTLGLLAKLLNRARVVLPKGTK